MPKFHRQNKKKVDPRYFLKESVEREDLIDDIREFSKEVAGSRNTYGDIDKLVLQQSVVVQFVYILIFNLVGIWNFNRKDILT